MAGRLSRPGDPMATDKQIAANRANAQHSTGPKTAAGKRRSSGNAFRHGLSGPLPNDELTVAATDAIVSALFDGADKPHEDATAFARSQLELRRIRKVRHNMLADSAHESLYPRELRRLIALDRYERVARTKSRRARQLISKRRNSSSDS